MTTNTQTDNFKFRPPSDNTILVILFLTLVAFCFFIHPALIAIGYA